MDWQSVAPDFEPDGSLRDIYVLDADLSDWQRVLDILRESYSLSYEVDGQASALPERVEEILNEWQEERAPVARFSLGGIDLACHFFSPEEIEFDFRPEEVTGPEQLETLIRFLRQLSEITGKAAIVAPENFPESPILRYRPLSPEAEFLPPPA